MTRTDVAQEILRVARALGIPPSTLSRDRFREVAEPSIAYSKPARDWTGCKRESSIMAEREATLPPVGAHLEARRLAERLKRAEAEKARLVHALAEAREVQDFLDATSLPNGLADVGVQRREKGSGLREGTAVVMWSDWHVEEPVEAEKVNGLNTYNLEIADQSVQGLVRGVVELIEKERHAFVIRDLVLWLGGDLFSGHIHEELVESGELSPVEAILWLQERIVSAVRAILDETDLERIVIPTSYGNHGRTTHKPRISTGAENSYEWLLYHQLRMVFENEPRVTVLVTKAQLLYLPVYDQIIRFTHGDAVKFAGGIGGVHIPLRKAIMGWDTAHKADLTCLGHFHTYLTHPRYVTNGSLIGYGPFAVRIRAEFEAPQQAFFVIDSRRGPTAHSAIWVR